MTCVRLESLGCRLNTSEMEALARELAAAGHRVVGPGEHVDLCIFNSCTVTAVAGRKCRRFIRNLRRRHPGAQLVVTGCLAEMEPPAVAALGVDRVVGNRHKDELFQLLTREGFLDEAEPSHQDIEGMPFPGPGRGLNTRAFLKVQDGCDNHCSFCVVTLARGEGRSVPPAQVVRRVHEMLEQGYREVVLSGVHLGSYGHDLEPGTDLRRLVEKLLESTDLARLRLSSLEPWDLGPDFFELFRDPRVLPHLHLPLQAGCDRTLRRMARRTTTGEYRRLVEAARHHCPELAVSTDVMVGFPGETTLDFEHSMRFVRDMAFARLHVFRYSARPGTAAAGFPQQVSGAESQERSRLMHQLGFELAEHFMRGMLEQTVPVLWEELERGPFEDHWSGLTPNYQRVVTPARPAAELANRITSTLLEDLRPGTLVGRILGVR